MLIIEDEAGLDSKILSVLENDKRFDGINDITGIQKHQLIEIQEFFETYKRLEPCGWVKGKELAKSRGSKKSYFTSHAILYNLAMKQKLKDKASPYETCL